jgi:SM-20-related protein
MQTTTLDLFTRLGLYVREGFLSAAECERLRVSVDAGPARASRVSEPGQDVLRDDVRRTTSAQVDAAALDLVDARLAAEAPALGRHFSVDLGRRESPRFLLYEAGGFYLKHRDSREGLTRRVSLVLFLNGQDDRAEPAPATYGGGSLVLYGLAPDPRLANVGFPLAGRPGLLVAFRSDLGHEVAPVSRGRRYSVVSWFH